MISFTQMVHKYISKHKTVLLSLKFEKKGLLQHRYDEKTTSEYMLIAGCLLI